MKNAIRLTIVVAGALGLSACIAGGAESQHAAAGGDLPQALLGFWHGLIAPITLIGEVVNRFAPHALPWTLRLYEKTGTGVAYDVGFWLGLAGGPSVLLRRWRR